MKAAVEDLRGRLHVPPEGDVSLGVIDVRRAVELQRKVTAFRQAMY